MEWFQTLFYRVGCSLGRHAFTSFLMKVGCPGSLTLPLANIVWYGITAETESGKKMMAPSGSSGGSNSGGGGSINMGGSSRSSGWTDFDLGVLEEPFPDAHEGGEEVTHQNPHANPVASRGEEAGPSNRIPPLVPYPYQADDMIGGDSVNSIQSRLLAKYNSPSYEEIKFSRIQAEDLLEVKIEILKVMAGLDPRGDWMGRGARALDNPHTATGEPSLEQLYALLTDLKEGGVQSKTFADLKRKAL